MATPETLLTLIRHGESSWNRAGRWQGHADPDLTETGRAQAHDLAEQIAARHREQPWSRLFSSDLLRARRTATILGDRLGLALGVDPRLRELDVGRWSGRTRAEIESMDAETLRRFELGSPGIRPGGGETRIEIRERSHAFVGGLVERHRGERILIVTHLGVIRALVPGAAPENLACVEVTAESILARGVDRSQRDEGGPL